MTPESVEFIFRSFQIFEKKFQDILSVLPLTEENKKAWSPELVNLFLDISSLFDSVSRHIVGGGGENTTEVQIQRDGRTTSRRVRDLDIVDFETNLFVPSEMIRSRLIVYTYPLQILTPFNDYRAPDGWWTAYNSLKHDRVRNYKMGTIENTFFSLAALFLLLVRHKGEEEFTKALLRYEITYTQGTAPEFVHEARVSTDRRGMIAVMWHDSALFGTDEIAANVPEALERITPPLASPKFIKFFGRFNP